ncbi:MAG: 4Fe-4S cluster-binding domain-containing protein [Bacilli bacterium]
MLANIGKIKHTDATNAIDNISTSVWFNGCPFRCTGCHNGSLLKRRESNHGLSDAIDAITRYAYRNKNVAILGGEPLEHYEATLTILQHAKTLNLTTLLWTGFDLENVPDDILSHVDYIKVGRYQRDLHGLFKYYGSSNQHMYRVVDGVAYDDESLN